jgi:chromate transporter
MSPPSTESPDQSAALDAKPEFRPGLLRLFVEFAKISLMGFGGVLVFTRRALVEKHRWMTANEFNEAFALAQFVPGPNVVNMAIIFGSRLRGIPGGLAVFFGLLGPPVIIVLVVAHLYASYGEAAMVQRVLHGISCAATGMFLAVALKMLMPIVKRREILPILVLIAVFVAIALMRWRLPYVLLVAAPVSMALTYVMRRRRIAQSTAPSVQS